MAKIYTLADKANELMKDAEIQRLREDLIPPVIIERFKRRPFNKFAKRHTKTFRRNSRNAE